jgi:alcohol dehydrogenase (cytochrome c)
MKKVLAFVSWVALSVFAQQPASNSVPPRPETPGTEAKTLEVKVYPRLCASCHGPDMRGGTAPSILDFVRYHTDTEVTDVLSNERSIFRTDQQMPVFNLPADQLSQLLTDLRVLAGTNPTMATGGYTGRSFVFGGGTGGFGVKWVDPDTDKSSIPSKPIPDFQPREATLHLADGKKLQGTLMAQTETDAELLTPDEKYHLLARDGKRYRDKPIEPKSDWLTYHGNVSGNRYSTLDQINDGNVQKLAVAWRFPIPTSPRLQGTPIVVDGIMYMTGWNELYALDATTGSPIWSYHEPHTPGILGEAGRGSNRGVAISGDRLFFLTDNAHLIAFNRFKGTKLWSVEAGSIKDGVMASSAPLVAGNVVIFGVGGGEEGIRGFIDAYSAETGEHAWRFYTIPKRGEEAAKTWMGNAIEHGCGATWMTGSYDPDLDLVYWGVGNPCPDDNGEQRIGDNLYTCSVVALSAKTGTLKWHFQFTPHDTHDWDSTQSMILADRKWDGSDRKLLIHGDRDGYFFVLDRTNGQLLLAQPMSSKVTWTKGYGSDGRPILTPEWEATFSGTATCPAGFGGTNWIDPSYDEQTNLFYVRASDSCGIYTAGVDPLTKVDRWDGGGTPSQEARDALKELSQGYEMHDYYRAIDVATGKKVWDYQAKERSGVLSTAGGLVLIGGPGGLTALDARTGNELTTVDADLPPTEPPVFAASPMTYMVGGKQYIVLSGKGVVVAYALRN